MAENTKIEWCDHTFNPWEGCQKVGPGCDHCYAEARNARFGGGTAVNWGPGAPRRRTSSANWRKPLQWNREAGVFYAQHRRRMRVFCASLADVFDNQADSMWRVDLFDLILKTPNLDWLLLTKRIGNAADMMYEAIGRHAVGSMPFVLPNVWLGATAVNQEEADRDIPKLLATPARVRFLSMEPLLGRVNLRPWIGAGWAGPGGAWCQGVQWVIVGGESGPGARPMHPAWARSLRDQCAAAGVPFLFKQWGEWSPGYAEHGNDLGYDAIVCAKQHEWPEGHCSFRVGKKAAGRLLDGVTHDGFPA